MLQTFATDRRPAASHRCADTALGVLESIAFCNPVFKGTPNQAKLLAEGMAPDSRRYSGWSLAILACAKSLPGLNLLFKALEYGLPMT